jgi:hypothetical protein
MTTIQHTASFSIRQPIDAVFPLFSPEGEKRWVPGWDYTNQMDTAPLAPDDVFTTTAHNHGTVAAIWIIGRYLPDEHVIQLYKIQPDDKVGTVTVQCRSRGPDQTTVQVTYKYTALSETGQEFIDSFTEEAYIGFIAEWRRLLEAHFAHRDNRPLPNHK